MATTEIVTIGDDVTWSEIEPDGAESAATGLVWGLAPSINGMRCWWVIPDVSGSGVVVPVVRASRRHRVGRAIPVRRRNPVTEVIGWTERWDPGGGRYVDVGEWFRETSPRSRFRIDYVPPTHAVMPPTHTGARTELDQFAALCERAERGDDFDFRTVMP